MSISDLALPLLSSLSASATLTICCVGGLTTIIWPKPGAVIFLLSYLQQQTAETAIRKRRIAVLKITRAIWVRITPLFRLYSKRDTRYVWPRREVDSYRSLLASNSSSAAWRRVAWRGCETVFWVVVVGRDLAYLLDSRSRMTSCYFSMFASYWSFLKGIFGSKHFLCPLITYYLHWLICFRCVSSHFTKSPVFSIKQSNSWLSFPVKFFIHLAEFTAIFTHFCITSTLFPPSSTYPSRSSNHFSDSLVSVSQDYSP